MESQEKVTAAPSALRCYASIRELSQRCALSGAISDLCQAIEKLDDAPESATFHLQKAIVSIAAVLPGWKPDAFQQQEVDEAIANMKVWNPNRFEA